MVEIAAEKSFENQVKAWLVEKGVYDLGTVPKKRINSHGFYIKRWSKNGDVKGLPDIYININGITLEAEIKATNGHPSDAQLFIGEQIKEAGTLHIILYPKDFDKFKRLVELLLKETPMNKRFIF